MTRSPEVIQETALIHIRPDVDQKVEALYQEGIKIREWAEARVIQSDEEVKSATDDLSIIAKLKKAIEAKRVEYTGPLNDHLRTLNDFFRRFTDPLLSADKLTREKVLAYKTERERVRQEQERINRLREEAAQAEMQLKGESTEPIALVEVEEAAPVRYRTDTGTLGTTKTWKFEVVDFALLPNEYKVADLVKIRKVVTAGVAIPGVRSWKEESLRVTTR